MNDRLKLDSQFESLMPAVPFSRRGFLISSAATGFALTAGPIMAQTMIVTPMDGLDGGDTQIPAKDGKSIPIYWAAPKAAGKRAVVLVVPEVWGAHEHIKDVARRLAKAGYFAVVTEPYSRIGDLTKVTDIKEVIAGANKLTDEQCFADLDSTVDWAAKHAKANTNKLGITGFCRGGRTVWQYTGHSKKIKAGVAWYGGLNPMPPAMPLSPIDTADKLNAPVLGLYGGADQGIPQNMVDRMNAALLAFGKNEQSMIHVYPDMPHAFNADYRPSYRKEAAEDGWKRMLAWFKKHGVA
ncbi:MAG: dienelactone hydrolase family protein [Burkholderiales bacterium]